MSDTTNASQTRETTDTEKKVFAYLNDLRISGVCNMFGASAFVQDEFEDIGPLESRSLGSYSIKIPFLFHITYTFL